MARMMREDGYSLQGMSRTIEGRQHPGPDDQFRRIDAIIAEFRRRASRGQRGRQEKEQLGPEYRAGRSWRPQGDPCGRRRRLPR